MLNSIVEEIRELLELYQPPRASFKPGISSGATSSVGSKPQAGQTPPRPPAAQAQQQQKQQQMKQRKIQQQQKQNVARQKQAQKPAKALQKQQVPPTAPPAA